jgi:hypothetical protein
MVKMKTELIDKRAVLEILKFKTIDDGGIVDDCIMQVLAWARHRVKNLSTIYAVNREEFEQIKWERDLAMKQLAEYGIKFGSNEIPESLRLKGEWEEIPIGRWKYPHCPYCNTTHDAKSNFCSNCGRDMRGTNK